MGESNMTIFAKVTSQAENVIRNVLREPLSKNDHPVLKLILLSLESEGEFDPSPRVPVTLSQWEKWLLLNTMSLRSRHVLLRNLRRVAERDDCLPPQNPTPNNLKVWAGQIVLMTLDEMDLMTDPDELHRD